MSTEAEVVNLKNECQKIIDGKSPIDGAYNLLESLEQISVTIDILTKTRIGMTVNELRKKSSDDTLAKRAKVLIRKWKTLLDEAGIASGTPASATKQKIEIGPPDAKRKRSSPTENNTPTPPAITTTENTPKETQKFKRAVLNSGDETRHKTVDLLKKSLASGDLPDHTQDPEEVAVRIEGAIFKATEGVNDKYRATVRSRVFNLRDKKNPDLRVNVLTGAVTAVRFASMSAEEMASNEMKKQREDFHKEGIMEHQMSVQEGTPSDMFRCGRCGKNNCTYTQVQTRSADEPMTTFVFCRSCGNRWKFC